jgi:phosphinothricin acetyltransferase
VLIRLGAAEDAAGVLAIYAPIVQLTSISFEISVPTVDEMSDRIVGRQPTHPFLVAEGPEGILGYTYAGRFNPRAAYGWTVETSVYVADHAQGQGVGRALYTALLEVLTLQGFRQAVGIIALPNDTSVALHQRYGFQRIGTFEAVGWKFGAWHDVEWWQRPLARAGTIPTPPVPLDGLGPGVLDQALAPSTTRTPS